MKQTCKKKLAKLYKNIFKLYFLMKMLIIVKKKKRLYETKELCWS